MRRQRVSHELSAADQATVVAACGGAEILDADVIQSVWKGYGTIFRCTFAGSQPSVVAKVVTPPAGKGVAHRRKIRSYEVEAAFYSSYAADCSDDLRIARLMCAQRRATGWLLVLEDLDAAGFPGRGRRLSRQQLHACLRWLARFHGTFLGRSPKRLWKTGTYWHLATRPDELKAMPKGPLRRAASAIDAKLSAATFKTLVHGDAKPANFCFRADGGAVAGLDFQYVGGGAGIKDVAYLLSGETRTVVEDGLAAYFTTLTERIGQLHPGVDAMAVAAEWRALYPWACADFQRFLAGWAVGVRMSRYEQALVDRVLALL